MEMSLTEAVFLALRHNRGLKSAYLDRVLQQFNLGRELRKFHPELEISMGADAQLSEDATVYRDEDSSDADIRRRRSGASVVTRISQKIPTGAEIAFVWDNRAETSRLNDSGSTLREDPFDSAWGVDISQPLLKGGGIEYNRASVKKAAIREEDAVRALRDRVISTISSVIFAYRRLLNAYQDVEVQRSSLEQAREQLEITQALIDSGRRAANEILQSEANLVRQELAVESANSRLEDARLALLSALNIGRDITIIPTESVQYRKITPDFQECLDIAFERNAGYLSALNQQRIARVQIMEVENERLWELSADASYRQGWHERRTDPDYRRDEWSVGLFLDVPLPIYGEAKYARESPLLSARIAFRKAGLEVRTREENLENEVRTAVRQVESAQKQVDLARRTRSLSEKSFEVSELQFKMGRISNNDFILDQDKLRNDRLAEIKAIVAYENTLTSLDQLLATTLETWEIEFEPRREELEEALLGDKTWMLGNTGVEN